jgi:Spy/CpxP family protein refolding chaperone
MLKLKIAVLLGSLLGVALTAGELFAQNENPPPVVPAPGGRQMQLRLQVPEFSNFRLLQAESVQNELKMTDEQKGKIKELMGKLMGVFRQHMAGMAGLDPEQQKAKREEMNKALVESVQEAEKGMAEVLQPQQNERLRQIRLQIQGVAAINDPEVAKALELTDQQREQLKTLNEHHREQMTKLMAEMRDVPPEQRAAKQAELREKAQAAAKDVVEKIEQLLTPEQKEKFEKLKGEKFDLSTLRQSRPAAPPVPQGRID